MSNIDTITAIATASGRGGIGILRVSGPLVPIIAPKLLGKLPNPRTAEYLSFLNEDGSILEKVIALFFPEPHSFTGENILEIHGHGGQMILRLLLERILNISPNIRLANPGEFTERAFLNGKIDLIQAESIADIINAKSYQAAKSASNSLQGAFSKKIHIILEKIINLRVYIESAIDFSDEDIDTISHNNIQTILHNIIKEIEYIKNLAHYGVLLREGIKIVIAGNPNSGKSSLFNALIGINRAIVSSISGTTRDTLCESMQLHEITCNITDTAGLKKNSENEIEKIGMKRTWHELSQSHQILWVIDSSKSTNKNDDTVLCAIKKILYDIKNKNNPTITIIRNKSDLSLEPTGISTINNYTCITLSALVDDQVNLLRSYLHNSIKNQLQNNSSSYIQESQEIFIARKRHINVLKKSLQFLLSAKKQLHSEIGINELFAEDIRAAHQELNKIFGKFTSEDLLKKIFNKFCIGK